MSILILCISLSVLAATSQSFVVKPQLQLEHKILLSELRYTVERLEDDEVLVAVVNGYLDRFLGNAVNLIKVKGYDPLSVQAVAKESWWGRIGLDGIKLDGLSSLHRPSDSEVKYNANTKHMRIELPLAVNGLKISATYSATILGLGPSGTVTGDVNGLEISAVVDVDMDKGGAVIEQFDITKDGKINITFAGHPFVDAILNTLVNAVSFLFDGVIVDSVNSVVKTSLQGLVDIVDAILSGLLNTEAGLTMFYAMTN